MDCTAADCIATDHAHCVECDARTPTYTPYGMCAQCRAEEWTPDD